MLLLMTDAMNQVLLSVVLLPREQLRLMRRSRRVRPPILFFAQVKFLAESLEPRI